jgi:hypothetical protein
MATQAGGDVEYRRAGTADYDQMVALQEANLVSNLSTDQKSDGFLSRTFNAAELAAMNEDLCIIVCSDNGEIKGLLATGTTDYNKQFDLPSAMIARYQNAMFAGKSLADWVSFVAGPVVIDKSARGTGAFEGLYNELFLTLPPSYEVAVTLISTTNGRSLKAHEKLGYEKVDRFTWNDLEFDLLARRVRQT